MYTKIGTQITISICLALNYYLYSLFKLYLSFTQSFKKVIMTLQLPSSSLQHAPPYFTQS